MNSAELQFILRMKDEATAALNRVGGSLGQRRQVRDGDPAA